MRCPCENCICLPMCRGRVVKKNRDSECLVIELLEKCSLIVDYFKSNTSTHAKHSYSTINKVCKCMNVKDDYFIWHENELSKIYNYKK